LDPPLLGYVTSNALNLETQAILLLALFSPLVELFPNLYMSWWAPTNGKLKNYIHAWPRRVAVVLTVWIPILLTLAKVIEPQGLIWVIELLVFSAFGLRLYFFDRAPNKNTSKIPEILYFIAFTSIGAVLYGAVPDKSWLVSVGILSIFFGASMMSTFRRGKHKNLNLDVLGRLIFTTGFLINLYNLARAAASVL
jgi:hypothetical protein